MKMKQLEDTHHKLIPPSSFPRSSLQDTYTYMIVSLWIEELIQKTFSFAKSIE